MENWKSEELAKTYLEGVRSAIPFAGEQLEIILRLIRSFKADATSFLDLGCGDGVLGKTLLTNLPKSRGIFLDFSEPMIRAARENCRNYKDQAVYMVRDMGDINWLDGLFKELPVDVVISGFAIHHQPDESKKRIYRDILKRVLKPGGVFLNLDQVKSRSPQIESVFNGFFMDRMRQYAAGNSSRISLETIEKEFYRDKEVNILAPVETQCDWLRESGFTQVDCFFKAFELSIFGGVKPA